MKEKMMPEEYVEIPANTVIHIAGYPFRIVAPVHVVGTPDNLSLALTALAESAANRGTDAQQAG